MRKILTWLPVLPAAAMLAASPAWSAVTYNLRDARFFGDTTGRETTAGSAFTAATSDNLPVTFSTGGGTPTLFDALSTTLGSPFQLGVYNHVKAGANTALTANLAPFDPITFASIVQSG